jgi:hypothetical protein
MVLLCIDALTREAIVNHVPVESVQPLRRRIRVAQRNRDLPIALQHRARHVLERGAVFFLAQGDVDVAIADQAGAHLVRVFAAVLDEQAFGAADEVVEPGPARDQHADQTVQQHQHGAGGERGRQRRGADDGAAQDRAQQDRDAQVEGAALAERAAPGDAQEYQREAEHDQRPDRHGGGAEIVGGFDELADVFHAVS